MNRHKLLRAIGFSNCSQNDVKQLIHTAIQSSQKKSYTSLDDDTLFAEYVSLFGNRIGLCVRGEFTENNQFIYESYFPIFMGKGISTTESVSVEQSIDRLTFRGIVNDYNIDITIMFFLSNVITYLKLFYTDRLPEHEVELTLSGLSSKGIVMLPIEKSLDDIQKENKLSEKKHHIFNEVKNGNREILESVTLSNVDLSTEVRKRLFSEDLYSIVDTTFMPYGIECDLYTIIGEITSVETDTNSITKEQIYILTIDVNGLVFDICINYDDITGEPLPGRRFKGDIWLQGKIYYPEED